MNVSATEPAKAVPAPSHAIHSSARRPSPAVALFVLAAAVTLSLGVTAGVGAVAIAPGSIAQMLAYHAGLIASPGTWLPTEEAIFFAIRLPRVVAAALVGAALATSGALFQGMLRNPLADPYVIGASAGAALGATVAAMLATGFAASFGLIPTLAFVGALSTVLVVYRLAQIGGGTSITTLLLAGMAVNAMLVAAMNLLLSVDDRLQLRMRALFAWLFGGIGVAGWDQLALIAPAVLILLVLAWLFAPALNALAVGEEGAAYLGVDVARIRWRVIAVASLMTALAVTIGGLISFVGLVVPHMLRMVLGPEHRLLLPASALAGALFLLWADAVARIIIAPAELPVGIITGLVGGPFFLFLLNRAKGSYAFG